MSHIRRARCRRASDTSRLGHVARRTLGRAGGSPRGPYGRRFDPPPCPSIYVLPPCVVCVARPRESCPLSSEVHLSFPRLATHARSPLCIANSRTEERRATLDPGPDLPAAKFQFPTTFRWAMQLDMIPSHQTLNSNPPQESCPTLHMPRRALGGGIAKVNFNQIY